MWVTPVELSCTHPPRPRPRPRPHHPSPLLHTRYPPCVHDYTPYCERQCGDKSNKQPHKHFGASAYAINASVTAIQAEILSNGPVEASFDVKKKINKQDQTKQARRKKEEEERRANGTTHQGRGTATRRAGSCTPHPAPLP